MKTRHLPVTVSLTLALTLAAVDANARGPGPEGPLSHSPGLAAAEKEQAGQDTTRKPARAAEAIVVSNEAAHLNRWFRGNAAEATPLALMSLAYLNLAEPDPGDAIEAAMAGFLDAQNLAGLSVAVMRDEEMIYAGGVGIANPYLDLAADEDTVYYLASVSKAVAGTLAARLEHDGRIDLGEQTRDVLFEVPVDDVPNTGNAAFDQWAELQAGPGHTSMPGFHQHTVRQLLAHTGCVGHYGEMPLPLPLHYNSELDAARQLWGTAPLSGCQAGNEYHYSTHAFSFIGASLERETGESIHELLDAEIASPLGLWSLRFSFNDDGMVEDSNRALPYVHGPGGNFVGVPYEQTSWKRLGGGMESSASDLARFGAAVLAGDVVPDGPDSSADGCDTVDGDVLNCVLWARQPNSDRGYAWGIVTRNGRRIATHSGVGAGFITLLDVLRDDGLVIALLTNTRDLPADFLDGGAQAFSLHGLSNEIASIVLD